jgi:hypothetical protein
MASDEEYFRGLHIHGDALTSHSTISSEKNKDSRYIHRYYLLTPIRQSLPFT